jgi:hypothetical protein
MQPTTQQIKLQFIRFNYVTPTGTTTKIIQDLH